MWSDRTPFDSPEFQRIEALAERAARLAGQPFDREQFRREAEEEARRRVDTENREPWQENA
jgi:hypothetical protein